MKAISREDALRIKDKNNLDYEESRAARINLIIVNFNEKVKNNRLRTRFTVDVFEDGGDTKDIKTVIDTLKDSGWYVRRSYCSTKIIVSFEEFERVKR